MVKNDYHVKIIQQQLTRNIGYILPDMVVEMRDAFHDNVPINESSNEWVSLKIFPTSMNIVARTASRALVGAPLCRNETYLKFSTTYAVDVIISAHIIGLFPRFMMG